MREVAWSIKGMEFFGTLCAEVLGLEQMTDGYVGACDRVHVVGLYDPPLYLHTLSSIAGAKEVVYHWCGTDVQVLQDASVLRQGIHVCDSDGLRRELLAKGIEATTVMWPTRHHFPVTPLHPEPTVSVYLGSSPQKYGNEIVQMLAEACPDIEFEGYMFGQLDPEQMAHLVDRSRVCLRLTEHDGSAATPREFMEAGRRAVVTHELPHAKQVMRSDLPGIIRALREALSHDEPDHEASAYWKAQNSDERFRQEMKGVLP